MDVTKKAKELGIAIRQRRKSLNLSQEDLSRLAECGPLFIIQLEAGKPTIQLGKVLAVLHVLGLQLRLESGHEGIVVS